LRGDCAGRLENLLPGASRRDSAAHPGRRRLKPTRLLQWLQRFRRFLASRQRQQKRKQEPPWSATAFHCRRRTERLELDDMHTTRWVSGWSGGSELAGEPVHWQPAPLGD
jgi:hypothetical protein